MNRNTTLVALVAIVLLILVGVLYFQFAQKASAPVTAATSTPAISATYLCDNGSIQASYTTGSVSLVLSDSRTFTLPQTVSASGARFESTSTAGTDIVFWNKGDNAMLMENGETTYNNCVANATPSTGSTSGTASSSSSTFTDQGHTFSFRYPSQFTVSGGDGSYITGWMNSATSSGMLLARLTIPNTFEPKTNLGDSQLTVGTSADTAALAQCTTFAESSGAAPVKSVVTINGVTYTKFVTSDAGAGNFYETTSYRTIRNKQCYALEYTIHSTSLGAYSPDQGISQFDHAKVQEQFETIVHSFKFL